MADTRPQVLSPMRADPLTCYISRFYFSINGFGPLPRDSRPAGVYCRCDYQLLYVVSGGLRLTVEGSVHNLEEGSLALVAPFTPYRIEPGEGLRCFAAYFDIYPDHRRHELYHALVGEGPGVYTVSEVPRARMLLMYMQEGTCPPGIRAEAEATLRLLCLNILRARGGAAGRIGAPVSAREAEIVEMSARYIQTHIQRPLRVHEICALLGISENYLYKCYMGVLNVPPSRYILQKKIRLSIDMMVASRMRIEDVAQRLGFSSLCHYSKTFKQLMGKSPRNYINDMA